MKTKYSDIVDYLNEKKCKIVTTEDEYYNYKGKYNKIDIISSCGHEYKQIIFSLFKQKGTGILCKNCINENRKTKGKLINKPGIDIENNAYNIIKNLCKNLDIINTNDGCLIDILIKPRNETLWLPFQLKSTLKKCYGLYGFGINKNDYSGMLVICVCIEDNKIWIMDNNLVNGKSSISIGLKKSKYNEYEINLNNFEEEIIKNYQKYVNYLIDKNIALIPKTVNSKLEHEYRLFRTEKIPFLIFEKPEKGNQVYDFTVNDYKVQEKIATKFKAKNAYCCFIHKNRGKNSNGKPQKTCYTKGDNDFYWINVPNKKTFFLIPEEKFIENGIINNDFKKKTLYIQANVKEDNWLFSYMFSYENPDKEKIISMFKRI